MPCLISYVVLLFCLTLKLIVGAEPVIEIEQGKLEGRIQQDIDGNNFYSFQGIPYAKPPLGNLRFKAPQPPESWSEVLDATKDGSECISIDILSGNKTGSEDCLFLNVFIKDLPNNVTTSSTPVMIWIHGGAFNLGSSRQDNYGPEFILTEDIVLVTLNYRLSVFGFLYMDDDSLEVTGNAGMKDMVVALKWVKSNIKYFGGNPDNVTIFGESAGGDSVHYLLLSPLAKSLFHKAIVQSGNAFKFTKRGPLVADLAKALNLNTTEESEILIQLQAIPADELYDAALQISAEVIGSNVLKRFGPVIENPSPTAFLPDKPINIINSGNYNAVPTIFGFCSREGMLQQLISEPEMPQDFEFFVPPYLDIPRGSNDSQTMAEEIKKFYYGKSGSEDIVDNFYIIYTDHGCLRDLHLSALLHSKLTSVYFYRVTIDTDLNIAKKAFGITAPGVCHGDDLGYLFKSLATPELVPGSMEMISLRRFVKLWTNFAKTGEPTSEGIDVTWNPIGKDRFNFMDIGRELMVGVNPEPDRMKFWKNIFNSFPDYNL